MHLTRQETAWWSIKYCHFFGPNGIGHTQAQLPNHSIKFWTKFVKFCVVSSWFANLPSPSCFLASLFTYKKCIISSSKTFATVRDHIHAGSFPISNRLSVYPGPRPAWVRDLVANPGSLPLLDRRTTGTRGHVPLTSLSIRPCAYAMLLAAQITCFSQFTTKSWNKIDPYFYQRQKCSPRDSVLSGNIRFMLLFAGVRCIYARTNMDVMFVKTAIFFVFSLAISS